jgi:Zn-dependent protease with chaperone function
MDFFEHQDIAKRKSKRLVLLFFVAIFLIIAVLNLVVFIVGNNVGMFQLTPAAWFTSNYFFSVTLGTMVVILTGSLFRAMQVNGGGRSIAAMVKGRQISSDTHEPQERQLMNLVEEMSIASGMPIPAVFIMDEEQGLNAFVAGLETSDTVLVVTKGLLDKLNRQELQGVIAHEYSHIFNADMRLNLRLIAILGGILAIGQLGYYMMRSLRFSGGRSRSSNKSSGQLTAVLFMASIALLIVGYIGLFFGRLIKAAVSRQREYLADAAAVQYSRDNLGIASALYKIKTNGKGSLLINSHAEDMSHMCFSSALNFKAFSSMLATHPPLDERISALLPSYSQQMAEREAEQLFTNKNAQFDNLSDSELSAISNIASQFSSSTTTASLENTSSEQLVASIGQMDQAHINYAHQMVDSLPALLLEKAHSKESISGLLLSCVYYHDHQDQVAITPEEMQTIFAEHAVELIKQIEGYKETISLLSPEQLMTIIDIALASFQQLELARQHQTLEWVIALSQLDQQLVPFEFYLVTQLQKVISGSDAKGHISNKGSTINNYRLVLKEINYLVVVLCYYATDSDQAALELAEQTMHSFDPKFRTPKQLASYEPKQFALSLSMLNRLSPLLKKPLLQTCADLVLHDQTLRLEELSLLRAIALYLECPMPPLITK